MKQQSLLIAAISVVLLSACTTAGDTWRVLVFSKTTLFRHDSITNGLAALDRLAKEHKFEVTASEDSSLFSPDGLARYKAVVLLNTSGDILDDVQQEALKNYVESGGGLVGIHAAIAGAVATEGEWGWYEKVACTAFTNHSAIVEATIDIQSSEHPSTRHLPKRWVRTDEWYNFTLNLRPRTEVLATLNETTYQGGTMGSDHPIAWCHRVGKGRFWYTALGHTCESYSEPAFIKHVLGGVPYAAGMTDSQKAGPPG